MTVAWEIRSPRDRLGQWAMFDTVGPALIEAGTPAVSGSPVVSSDLAAPAELAAYFRAKMAQKLRADLGG